MRKIPRTFRPCLETLESRWTPAGGITAVLTGGNLTLTGDADDNAVAINQQSDDRLVLVPLSATQVRFGNNGIFQGVPLTIPVPVTGNLTVNLLDGDDNVVITQVRLPRTVTINGGNGNNTAGIQGAIIGRNLSITNQDGDDSAFFGGLVTVGGKLNVSHGNGSSLVDDATGMLVVSGDLNLTNGNGPGTVSWESLSSLEVCGQFSINHGAADASPNSTMVAPTSRLELGSLRVTNGRGADTTVFESDLVTILGSTTINNGDADNVTRITGLTNLATGAVSIRNGDGTDMNTITGNIITVAGSITLNNGTDANAGSNTIAATSSLTISGNVVIRNGAGVDTNVVEVTDPAGTTRVFGNMSLQNGAGGSTTLIGAHAGELVMGGTTQITSTGGNDDVFIGSPASTALTLGNTTISNGEGTNQTSIRGVGLVVNGSVTVNGGTGTDRVQVSSIGANAVVTRSLALNLGSGDQQFVLLSAETDARTFTVGQGLNISATGVGGQHLLLLVRLVVLGSTSVTTGDGRDTIRVDDSIFAACAIRTNGGDDTIRIDAEATPTSNTRFRGPFSALTGDGADLVIVGLTGVPQNQAIFATGTNTFNGGAGADELRLFTLGNATFFAGLPVPTQFEIVN